MPSSSHWLPSPFGVSTNIIDVRSHALVLSILGLMAALLVMYSHVLTRAFLRYRHAWNHRQTGAAIPSIPPLDPRSINYNLQGIHFFGPPARASLSYPPVYQTWDGMTPVLILAHPDACREFYRDHLSHPRQPDFTCLGSIGEALLGRAIGTSYGDEWRQVHQRLLVGPMSTQAVPAHMAMINNEVAQWVTAVMSLPTYHLTPLPGTEYQQSTIDTRLDRLTLRILSKVVYGHDLTTQQMARIEEVAGSHERLMSHMGSRATRFPGYKYLPTAINKQLSSFTAQWRALHKSLAQTQDKRSIMRQLRDTLSWQQDICGEEAASGSNTMSEAQILDNMDEILLFNIDVMYSALGAILVNLAKYPEWQERLAQEAQEVLGDLPPRDISLALLQKLELTEMFVLESARLWPSLALSFPEHTARDSSIAGYRIPAGTMVLVDIVSINTSAEYHGDDAHVFNPMRFERRAGGNDRYKLHRFGLGPRKCLGRHFAQTIILSTIGQLLRVGTVASAPRVASKGAGSSGGGNGSGSERGPLEIGLRAEGLPFFTPYLDFPALSIKAHPVHAAAAKPATPATPATPTLPSRPVSLSPDSTPSTVAPSTPAKTPSSASINISTSSSGSNTGSRNTTPTPMSLYVPQTDDDACFQTGRRLLDNKGTVLMGVSLGNGFFTRSNISGLTEYFADRATDLFPFIPARPSLFTMTMGGQRSPEQAWKKIKRDERAYVRMLTAGAQAHGYGGQGKCTLRENRWIDESLYSDPVYAASLDGIMNLYAHSSDFRHDARQLTTSVASRRLGPCNDDDLQQAVDHGVNFILQELAFLIKSPQLLDCPAGVCYVYHRPWPIFNKLITGAYGNSPVHNVGYAVVGDPTHWE